MNRTLLLGGPFHRLAGRVGLSGPRLALAALALAWLPLPVLCLAAGGGAAVLGFLRDAEAQARLLAALPILILAEGLIESRVAPVPEQFLANGLVAPQDRPDFDLALETIARRREGPLELGLIALVVAFRVFLWRIPLTLPESRWCGALGAQGSAALSPAGWWYALVSMSFYQFVLLRWALRFFLWAGLLWRLSRLRLALVPAHPDRCGGLGFLEPAAVSFGPILFSQSLLLAAALTQWAPGPAEWSYDKAIAAIFAGGILVILGPLVFFCGRLARARRRARRDYGELAGRWARGFEGRWVGAPALPGSADLQGLSALEGSFQLVLRMRPVPFGFEALARLALWTVVPWLPAALLAGQSLEVFKLLLKALL